MPLIAFRPEYQITAEPDQNRLFYKVFAEMQQAQALPHYLADWAAALAAVHPGFTILTNVASLTDVSPDLQPLFVAAQQLIVAQRVAMVAEVHRPDSPTHTNSADISIRSGMPVRTFVDAWEASRFLDEFGSGR